MVHRIIHSRGHEPQLEFKQCRDKDSGEVNWCQNGKILLDPQLIEDLNRVRTSASTIRLNGKIIKVFPMIVASKKS